MSEVKLVGKGCLHARRLYIPRPDSTFEMVVISEYFIYERRYNKVVESVTIQRRRKANEQSKAKFYSFKAFIKTYNGASA